MTLILKFVLFIILVFSRVSGQIEDDIDEFIDAVLNCTDIPGLSLSVVADMQEFLTKGYGVEDIVTERPVSASTQFMIASVTKAFAGISAAIVLKNSEGVTWETPVRDVLGDSFYLYDAVRTQHANLHDLYGHRLGLPAHNAMRIAGYTLEELVSKLQYVPPLADFRTVRMYNNIVYGLAEYVLQTLDGRMWRDIVRHEIFQPLGMTNSTFVVEVEDWSRVAKAYYNDDDGQLREVSNQVPLAYYTTHEGSSGSIVSTAEDMSKWIVFQLSEGLAPDGSEILSPAEFSETHNPLTQTVILTSPFRRPNYPVTYHPPASYSTGWTESTYRGYNLQMHQGSLEGHRSHLVILPDMATGVFINVNKAPEYFAMELIAMYILDLILGEEPWVTSDTVCDTIIETPVEKYYNYDAKQTKKEVSHIKTDNARMLDEYVGVYGHYAYGNLTFELDEMTGGLVMFYGDDNHAWDLTEDLRPDTFTGHGREPFWYWRVPINFDMNGTDFPSVTVWFEPEYPPQFQRDLDLSNPPPPPELCPE